MSPPPENPALPATAPAVAFPVGTGIVPRHFHSLDALRGVAALSVVVWHWQHFFFQGTTCPNFHLEKQPLYFLFKPLYLGGWRAVDLFFCLSGFIFYWLYAEKIKNREVSQWQFFLLRFSRLYPLHCATLLFVALGQRLMFWRYHTFYVYSCNDLFHFALQTVFASNWGFERGDSFNGPVWSVSVEVLLYAIFFLACFLNLRRWGHLALFVVGAYLLSRVGVGMPARGLLAFFAGGLTFHSFTGLMRHGISRSTLQFLGLLTLLLWIAIPLNAYHDCAYHLYRAHGILRFHGKDIGGFIILSLSPLLFQLLLFPLTILTLALWESRGGKLAGPLAFLGDISYSSYLLHFPLQMVFLGVTLVFGIPNTFFYSPLSLGLFFVVLVPLSMCSYRFFERPCQLRIRAWPARRPKHGKILSAD